jgi:hypothetical protein
MMARLAARTAVIVGLAVVVGASPGGATGSSPDPTVAPCPNGRPVGPRTVCRGPIVHHSGGGGGAVTIVLSVVVGLGVAAGALLLVRRRITLDAAGPPRSRPSPGPR